MDIFPDMAILVGSGFLSIFFITIMLLLKLDLRERREISFGIGFIMTVVLWGISTASRAGHVATVLSGGFVAIVIIVALRVTTEDLR